MPEVFDSQSPERGWPPFMDWLTSVGLDPALTKSVEIVDDGSAARAVVFDLNEHGKKFIVGDDISAHVEVVSINTLPPRRAS